jgi:hypothetical protein
VGGDRAVVRLRIEDVRQPLGPCPLRLVAGAEGDGDVVRRVRHGGLQQQRAGDPEDAVPVTDDADVPGPVQRHGERAVGGSSEAALQGAGPRSLAVSFSTGPGRRTAWYGTRVYGDGAACT